MQGLVGGRGGAALRLLQTLLCAAHFARGPHGLTKFVEGLAACVLQVHQVATLKHIACALRFQDGRREHEADGEALLGKHVTL